MSDFIILRCCKCGEIVIYSAKLRVKCSYCRKPIKPDECHKIAFAPNAEQAGRMYRAIRTALANEGIGG